MAFKINDIYWNKLMEEFVTCLGPLNWTKRTIHLRPLINPRYTYSTASKNLVKLSANAQRKVKVIYGI